MAQWNPYPDPEAGGARSIGGFLGREMGSNRIILPWSYPAGFCDPSQPPGRMWWLVEIQFVGENDFRGFSGRTFLWKRMYVGRPRWCKVIRDFLKSSYTPFDHFWEFYIRDGPKFIEELNDGLPYPSVCMIPSSSGTTTWGNVISCCFCVVPLTWRTSDSVMAACPVCCFPRQLDVGPSVVEADRTLLSVCPPCQRSCPPDRMWFTKDAEYERSIRERILKVNEDCSMRFFQDQYDDAGMFDIFPPTRYVELGSPEGLAFIRELWEKLGNRRA